MKDGMQGKVMAISSFVLLAQSSDTFYIKRISTTEAKQCVNIINCNPNYANYCKCNRGKWEL